MRIVIIGAVAAGTSAAAKARRNSEDLEIVIYEKENFISYSGCGMPYYIGGEVESAEELTPRDPGFFKSKYNVDIHTLHEVISISPDVKSITVKNLATGDILTDHYDKLVIATGARATTPPRGTTEYRPECAKATGRRRQLSTTRGGSRRTTRTGRDRRIWCSTWSTSSAREATTC